MSPAAEAATLLPSLDPAALEPRPQPDFGSLAARLESQLDPLCEDVLARALPADRPRPEAPPLSAQLTEAVRLSLAEQLRALAADARPQSYPDSAAEAARLAADLDLTLDLYRASHAILWQAWFELVEGAALGPAERRELLRRASEFFFDYAGRLGEFAAEADRRRLDPSSEQRRFRAIRDLLAGDSLALASINFDLDRHHLALIAWGGDPKAAVRSLAERLGRPLLAVSPLDRERSCWAWISGIHPLGPDQQLLLRDFDPGGARLALGLEAIGEEGFRASHRQALRARRLAPDHGAALIGYADVAVEALAVENEEDARAFVANELRGIEDDSARSRCIRETLAAYFAAEYNAACAGATLGIHQQTVANRLRAAEERLGQPSIRARRVELELALRLRAILPQQP